MTLKLYINKQLLFNCSSTELQGKKILNYNKCLGHSIRTQSVNTTSTTNLSQPMGNGQDTAYINKELILQYRHNYLTEQIRDVATVQQVVATGKNSLQALRGRRLGYRFG